MLPDESRGEGIVGEHHLTALRLVPGDQVGTFQGVADAPIQFRGRLPGEGQAEDLLGPHLSGADQPHDPGGHDRGFPRTRTGDDHLRFERGADGAQLFRAERDSECVAQVTGVVQPFHPKPPGLIAGQEAPNAHHMHCGPSRASKVPCSRISTACSSFSVSQEGPSGRTG